MAPRDRVRPAAAKGLKVRRRRHGGHDSAADEHVKAVSRVSGGAQAPALTRSPAAETLKASNSTLTRNTVAEAPRRGLEGRSSGRGGDVQVNAACVRVSEHANGAIPGCFTFFRRPVVLAYSERYERIDEAIAAERRIKGWSRAKKEAYMRGDYERLSRLAKRRRGGGLIAEAVERTERPSRPLRGASATVLRVKVELLALSVSAAGERVKAGACAPPLTRLTALTCSSAAKSCPPCLRRRTFNPLAAAGLTRSLGAMAFCPLQSR